MTIKSLSEEIKALIQEQLTLKSSISETTRKIDALEEKILIKSKELSAMEKEEEDRNILEALKLMFWQEVTVEAIDSAAYYIKHGVGTFYYLDILQQFTIPCMTKALPDDWCDHLMWKDVDKYICQKLHDSNRLVSYLVVLLSQYKRGLDKATIYGEVCRRCEGWVVADLEDIAQKFSKLKDRR
jgi:hypothetical protein